MLGTAERTHEIRLSIPAEPSSLGVVRRAVHGLDDICGVERTDQLAVILSELVTNSIRHAGLKEQSRIEIEVEAGEQGLRGRVVDPGPGFDPSHIPKRPLDEGGLGLRIVDRTAKRWGVNRGDGTEVWFEI